jgi:hypothetical protein
MFDLRNGLGRNRFRFVGFSFPVLVLCNVANITKIFIALEKVGQ